MYQLLKARQSFVVEHVLDVQALLYGHAVDQGD
jgi:hypothetical protein